MPVHTYPVAGLLAKWSVIYIVTTFYYSPDTVDGEQEYQQSIMWITHDILCAVVRVLQITCITCKSTYFYCEE